MSKTGNQNIQPKLPSGKGQTDVGQVADCAEEKYAKPFEPVDSGVFDMDSLKDDIGEKSGFQSNTDGYIVKKGMVYGEAAKLNIMPPGMDISDQPYKDIRDMKLKVYEGGVNFPGDGAFPPRDLEDNPASKGSVAGYASRRS
jgi:hypothetical protein